MRGIDMRGMASWIVVIGFGVLATGCPPGGKGGGTGPGNGSNDRGIRAEIPTLVDLDKLRLVQRDALPFESLVPRNFCFAPPAVDPATIDVDRSLFVHDRATLDAADFSLKRTLGKIASDAVAAGAAGATAETLFRDLWDTQNPQTGAATPAGAQCDDNTTTLNGFPNACRTVDGAQAKAASLDAEMATYRAVGIVNRLDLAAEGWKNCGEHRIVYGRQGAGIQRSFIIFEAVLPNPRPGCESGCRAVAEHWVQLSSVADPVERAKRLEKLFYTGLPGYQPVVRLDHYAAKTSGGYSGGSGQIRTNQFLEQPWMLKEFKLALDCTITPCVVEPVPIPVKVNPDGELWTESTTGLANAFQHNVVLPQVSSLGVNDINKFSYQVPLQFDAARSQPQSPGLRDHYFESYTAVPGVPAGFRASLGTAAGTTSPALTDKQVVNRALALSCAGCHQPTSFNLTLASSIGPGMSWPNSAGFVHVKAEAVAGVHALSPALTSTFLPARAKNLADMLSDDVCFCRFRKLPIDASKLEQAVFSKPPATLVDIRTAEDNLKRQIDTELTRQKLAPLPDLAPEAGSTPLVLDEVKAAGPAPAARSTALRSAVQKLVAGEPPRKTVTGHFRAE
jgi:hypothetical protein